MQLCRTKADNTKKIQLTGSESPPQSSLLLLLLLLLFPPSRAPLGIGAAAAAIPAAVAPGAEEVTDEGLEEEDRLMASPEVGGESR